MRGRAWSLLEKKFLSDYPMMSGKDMADRLERTEASVSGKRYKMGIATKKNGESHRNSKITAEHAEMMRILSDNGYKAGKIKSLGAAIESIAVQSVDDVINYRSWR